jgi:preprotein translocase subunit YajC
VQFVLIALALVIFWLVVMAPARRQQKKVSGLQQELQVGDEVVISAGIYGTVRSVEETRVTLEVAPGTVLTVARQVVVRRQEPAPEAAAAEAAAGGADTLAEADTTPEPRATTDEAPEARPDEAPRKATGTED